MLQVFSAAALSHDPVVNSAGETLGKLEDFMVDLDNGRIRYAVLSFGGTLGFGNKLFAVPAEALSVDSTARRLVLDVDKSLLEKAPGFDRDTWPDFADPAFGREIYTYYGRKPYWG